ncbi:hypothetical protein IFM89_005901 [Coptis chinensis]|uniref:Protein NO VEIN C-terminal domain-containing protein n=1 Tax=Coptis chinensis TaxID=261450 RepID=A0A835HR69_9MAGN|nr:hypothetical protein IFM89_005901 [Coptis chinensis]
MLLQCGLLDETNYSSSKTISHVYEGLHDFFVDRKCKVSRDPPSWSYMRSWCRCQSCVAFTALVFTPNEYQAAITGRTGEFVAFKYFTDKGEPEKRSEYIEVKATKSAKKDWFAISTRGWQFAVEKGESFSIAHVVLVGPNIAKNFDSLTLLACDTDALSFPLQEETSKTPVSKKGCVAFVGYMPGGGKFWETRMKQMILHILDHQPPVDENLLIVGVKRSEMVDNVLHELFQNGDVAL